MRRLHDARLIRGGFTLIELLVVTSIIAILAALTVGAVLKYFGTQPANLTRTEFKSLQDVIQKKWNEVTTQARSSSIQGSGQLTVTTNTNLSHADYGKLLALAGGIDGRMRVIWVKIQQRLAFPENFTEAMSGVTIGTISIPPVPAYVAYLQKYGLKASATPQPYESAVCLAMALQRNVSGIGTITPETFGSGTFVSTNIAPNQCPCLVDGWKNPLVFSRWPVGLNLNVTTDPSDPDGLLAQSGWTSTGFTPVLHVIQGQRTPTIASAGADGILGLDLTSPGQANHWAPINLPATYDNIYSDTGS